MNIRSISPAGFTSAILLFCIVVGASFLCGSIENTGNPAAGSSGILQVGHGIQPAYENQDPASSADVPVANFSAKAGAITRFSVFFDGTPSKGSDLSYQWSFEDGSVLSSPKPVKFLAIR